MAWSVLDNVEWADCSLRVLGSLVGLVQTLALAILMLLGSTLETLIPLLLSDVVHACKSGSAANVG